MPKSLVLRRVRELFGLRRRPRQILIAATFAFAISLVSDGCVRRTDLAESGAKVPVVQFAFWGGQNEVKLLLGLIDKFERANPDIKVKPIHIAGDFSAKLQTMIAADRAPDVFYLVSQDCNDYLHKRALRDLQPFIDKSKAIKLDDFYQDTVKQFRIEGKTYALSCNWSPMVVFYNKDFFDEAGVPYPKPGWTWTDFLQTAQKLTVRDARGRVQRFGTMSVDWKQWVVQAGGDFFNEAGDNCTLDSPESLKGLQFAYDLTARYNVCPPQNDAEAESSIYFMAGKTAMVFSYRWFITLLEPLKRYQWGICASPKGDKNVNLSGALGFAMSSQSKRPDAAWRFIEFMTGPPGQILFGKNRWGTPTLKPLVNRYDLFDEPTHPNFNYRLFAQETPRSRILVGSPYIPDQRFNDFAISELDRMYLGDLTPAETLKSIAKKVNDTISKNKKVLGKVSRAK